jgi:hypothetical protein
MCRLRTRQLPVVAFVRQRPGQQWRFDADFSPRPRRRGAVPPGAPGRSRGTRSGNRHAGGPHRPRVAAGPPVRRSGGHTTTVIVATRQPGQDSKSDTCKERGLSNTNSARIGRVTVPPAASLGWLAADVPNHYGGTLRARRATGGRNGECCSRSPGVRALHAGEVSRPKAAFQSGRQTVTRQRRQRDVSPPAEVRRHRQNLVAAWVGSAAGVLALALTALIAWNPWAHHSHSGAPGRRPSPSKAIALGVASEYPWTTGCPGNGMVAMPPGGGRIEDFHAVTDLRPSIVNSGSSAGSWAVGSLYMDLSSAGPAPIEIVDVKPHILRRDLGSPAWIYQPSSGCGPIPPDRIFRFDLDRPKWTDEGVNKNGPMGPPSSDVPTAALGPSFVIQPDTHARIRVSTLACHGNYEWNLDIVYAVPGATDFGHDIVGPFDSYGLANNTTLYQGQPDDNGVVKVGRQSVISGSPKFFCSD